MHPQNGDLRICNVERDEELSKRIQARLTSDATYSVCYDPRPIGTKYTDLQVIDCRSNGVSHDTPVLHNVKKTLFCGTNKAPWNGFATAIDTESSLRNQFFAIQKCEQSNFIPSTDSDMYVVEAQPDPPLELTHKPSKCAGVFNKSTRVDRMNSKCKC